MLRIISSLEGKFNGKQWIALKYKVLIIGAW